MNTDKIMKNIDKGIANGKKRAAAKSKLNDLFMPRALTAENGAKGLLNGEFHEEVEVACPDCDGGEWHDLETDQCGTCKDTGQLTQKVPISWTTIKAIYAMTVKHLGASRAKSAGPNPS